MLGEEQTKGVDRALVLLGFGVNGVTAAPEGGLFLGGVLLLEDAEVGFDAVVGYGLGPQEFVEILPFSLEAFADALCACDDGDEAVDDVEGGFHQCLVFIIKFDKQSQTCNLLCSDCSLPRVRRPRASQKASKTIPS